ncbi:MAG: flagellar motor switch protein FliG [Spirochaetes bacterium]|nr:flagellar motor switch protein FliG [Spirochaetota bacterium]
MGNLLRHGIDAYRRSADITPEKDSATPAAAGMLKTSHQNKGLAENVHLSWEEAAYAKTGVKPQTKPAADSKYRRVAKFLIIIGRDNAAKILSELDAEQVEKISKEISTIHAIHPQEAAEITVEFQELFSVLRKSAGTYPLNSEFSRGGIDTARQILHTAMGRKRGDALLKKAVPDTKEKLFDFLKDFTPKQLEQILKSESPQTQALVLSRLPPKVSAQTISGMPADKKLEVLKRIARQSGVMPEVLEKVAEKLKEKASFVAAGNDDLEIDGMQALASILKTCDFALGDKIISAFEQSRPDLGKTLKEKLYTLDDIINCLDRPLQEKLKTMSDRELAILLKGRKEDFAAKIMSNVSDGRQKLIEEELALLGPIPKRDWDAAARDFLMWFRDQRENSGLILTTDEDIIE